MKKKVIIFISVFILLITIVFSQITLFAIQPIGAIPEGKTLVILKLNKTNFIDSADAMCVREIGGVSLLCRMSMLSAVTEKSIILLRLPYIEMLYKISTNGKEFSK
jgi:hypothetical protein